GASGRRAIGREFRPRSTDPERGRRASAGGRRSVQQGDRRPVGDSSWNREVAPQGDLRQARCWKQDAGGCGGRQAWCAEPDRGGRSCPGWREEQPRFGPHWLPASAESKPVSTERRGKRRVEAPSRGTSMKADGMPGIHSMRTCEVCGTEMPLDEAIIPEASDYLIY